MGRAGRAEGREGGGGGGVERYVGLLAGGNLAKRSLKDSYKCEGGSLWRYRSE